MPLDEQGGRGVPQRMRRHNECAETECASATWMSGRASRGPAHNRQQLLMHPGQLLPAKLHCCGTHIYLDNCRLQRGDWPVSGTVIYSLKSEI